VGLERIMRTKITLVVLGSALLAVGCTVDDGTGNEGVAESAAPLRTTTTTMLCASENDWYRNCYPGGFIKRVELVSELSEGKCRRYSTWGYYDQEIWVDDGCKAMFEVTYEAFPPSPKIQILSASLGIVCGSVDDEIAERCEGKETCDFDVPTIAIFGAPAKPYDDFRLDFACADKPSETHHAYQPAPAAGARVHIDCRSWWYDPPEPLGRWCSSRP
jgi:hypothetical protein